MASRACVFLLVLLLPVLVARESVAFFVVWNVGQGLWTTAVSDQVCLHLDMGGERAPWSRIMSGCRGFDNQVHLSHWDWDHISFVGGARNLLPNLCRLNWPGMEPSAGKSARVRSVPVCGGSRVDDGGAGGRAVGRFVGARGRVTPADERVDRAIGRAGDLSGHGQDNAGPLQTWDPVSPRSTNAASSVVLWRDILVPGDSDRNAEKYWSSALPGVGGTRVLVLGHHGSRTSTSRELLTRLPNLKMAIVSARRRRYGHPHIEVLQLLRDFRVPVLNTEDWGNIFVWE